MDIIKQINYKKYELGLNQIQFAVYLDVSLNTVIKIEKGEMPSQRILNKIMKKLNIEDYKYANEKKRTIYFLKSVGRLNIPSNWTECIGVTEENPGVILYLIGNESNENEIWILNGNMIEFDDIKKSDEIELESIEKLMLFNSNGKGAIIPKLSVPLDWLEDMDVKIESPCVSIQLYKDESIYKSKIVIKKDKIK
ncbi:TPA: helix-turn-helix transcriptional regulator [Clostridioides difficile]|nr:helix-turn-helix transcriptional regulator [Clostridioides difficile]HBF0433977.1 helix-turn-helix transcriptional regulator [Clostridioides difficile]